jgi:citronellol/citronellal dehydrogenase
LKEVFGTGKALSGSTDRKNQKAEGTKMRSLKGKTIFISGASRGIGLAIALKAAREGANIIVAAKTTAPHPKLPGTIYTAADEIERAGGKALPVEVDIRSEEQVREAVRLGVERFGGIDILVNNASAISLTGTAETPMKRFDLMMGVNMRGTFLCSQACLPHLVRAENPHILMLSPPLDMRAKWFAPHVAYTMSKYGMSMCVLGMAEEFRAAGVAVNALWPRTLIATSALQAIPGAPWENGRTPQIAADAAVHILKQESRELTGQFLIDEEVLAGAGVSDLSDYSAAPGNPLMTDLFLE